VDLSSLLGRRRLRIEEGADLDDASNLDVGEPEGAAGCAFNDATAAQVARSSAMYERGSASIRSGRQRKSCS
jgi:hypothetical protein